MWQLREQNIGFLNDTQKAQVRVLFNALQPGDKERKVPNAEQAGAVEYIDQLLAREESIFDEISKWRVLYANSLMALNDQASMLFKNNLQSLSENDATELLSQLEESKLSHFQFDSEEINQGVLFDTFRRHCIQGCFCDPRWGGNKEGVMWKWFGYQEETKEIGI